MKRVDFNVDVGEGFPHDEELLEFATSANVCCGEHAGSWELTLRSIDLCLRKGIRIGCHPGFPDRAHFGLLQPSREEFEPLIRDAVKQVKTFAGQIRPLYIKPHGALYQILSAKDRLSAEDPGVFGGCCGAFFEPSIIMRYPMMLLPHSRFGMVVRATFVKVYKEGFADRRYSPNGELVPRSNEDALLYDPEEIRRQILQIAPKVDSINLQSDRPGCVERAELLNKTLVDAGYEVGF
jgi:UPF0271 protein